MNQLADWHIQKELENSLLPFIKGGPSLEPAPMIEPWRAEQLQSASYDLRLGHEVRTEYGISYDLRQEHWHEHGWSMPPGQFLLGHTEEHIRMPPHLAGRVEGKSTIGRQGLAVHVTAGFIDPGFHGQITLELVNHKQSKGFRLRPGMLIAQITFHSLSARPRRLYGDPALGSHYQNQLGATPPVE